MTKVFSLFFFSLHETKKYRSTRIWKRHVWTCIEREMGRDGIISQVILLLGVLYSTLGIYVLKAYIKWKKDATQ